MSNNESELDYLRRLSSDSRKMETRMKSLDTAYAIQQFDHENARRKKAGLVPIPDHKRPRY